MSDLSEIEANPEVSQQVKVFVACLGKFAEIAIRECAPLLPCDAGDAATSLRMLARANQIDHDQVNLLLGTHAPGRRDMRPLMAHAVEEVIRACGQFIPPEAMSAVASLERLAALAGLPKSLLTKYIQP